MPDTLLNKPTILTLAIIAFPRKLKEQVFSNVSPFCQASPCSNATFPKRNTTLSARITTQTSGTACDKATLEETPRWCVLSHRKQPGSSLLQGKNMPNDTCQGSKPNCFNTPKTCLPQGLTSIATDQENIKLFLRTCMYPSEGVVTLSVLLMRLHRSVFIIQPTYC